MVHQLFDSTDDERARYYLLNGPPDIHVDICPRRSATKIEAWFYGFQDMSDVIGALYSRRLRPDQYAVIFYRRLGVAPWRAWLPSEDLALSSLQSGGRIGGSAGKISAPAARRKNSGTPSASSRS